MNDTSVRETNTEPALRQQVSDRMREGAFPHPAGLLPTIRDLVAAAATRVGCGPAMRRSSRPCPRRGRR